MTHEQEKLASFGVRYGLPLPDLRKLAEQTPQEQGQQRAAGIARARGHALCGFVPGPNGMTRSGCRDCDAQAFVFPDGSVEGTVLRRTCGEIEELRAR